MTHFQPQMLIYCHRVFLPTQFTRGSSRSHPKPQIVQCPCMTASALSILFFARFREKGAKNLIGVEGRGQGAVLWRSSRPLTPVSTPSQLTRERRAEFFSELRSIFERPSCFCINDQSPSR